MRWGAPIALFLVVLTGGLLVLRGIGLAPAPSGQQEVAVKVAPLKPERANAAASPVQAAPAEPADPPEAEPPVAPEPPEPPMMLPGPFPAGDGGLYLAELTGSCDPAVGGSLTARAVNGSDMHIVEAGFTVTVTHGEAGEQVVVPGRVAELPAGGQSIVEFGEVPCPAPGLVDAAVRLDYCRTA